MNSREARPGVIASYLGTKTLLRLDHQVPGDATLWSCDVWLARADRPEGGYWSAEEFRAELSDLTYVRRGDGLPSIEELHAAMASLPAALTDGQGRAYVGFWPLAYALFPKGDERWKVAVPGQRNPAFAYMQDLAYGVIPGVHRRSNRDGDVFAIAELSHDE